MKKQLKLIVFMLLALCFTLLLAQPDILAPDETYQEMQDHHKKMFTEIFDVLLETAKSDAETLQARREELDEQLKALHLKAVEVYQNALDQGETPDAADALAREATIDEYTVLSNESTTFKEDLHTFVQGHPEAMKVFESMGHEPYIKDQGVGQQGQVEQQGTMQGMQQGKHQGQAGHQGSMGCMGQGKHGGQTGQQGSMDCCCMGQGKHGGQTGQQGSMGCMQQGKHQGQAGQQGSMGCMQQGKHQGQAGHQDSMGCMQQGKHGGQTGQQGSMDCCCMGQGKHGGQTGQQGSMGCMQQGKHQGQAGHQGSMGCMQQGSQGMHQGQGRHQGPMHGMMQGMQGQGPMQGLLNEQQIKALFVRHTGYLTTGTKHGGKN